MIANAADWDPSVVKLRWMPAHTAWANIPRGSTTKSERQGLILRIDWQCNIALDALAKNAAEKHRMEWRVRNKMRKTRIYTRSVRCRLGAVTWASQSITKHSTLEDGTTRSVTVRDSIGKPAGNAPRKFAKKIPIKKADHTKNSAPSDAIPSALPKCAENGKALECNTITGGPDECKWAAVAEVGDKLFQACESLEARITIGKRKALPANRKRRLRPAASGNTAVAPACAKTVS